MPEYKSPINGQPLPQGKPFRTSEQAREAGKKGGKASAAKRAARKTLRDELEVLLAEERPDGKGGKASVQFAMTTALVKQALDGNTRAYEIIRDTLGQKPAETVNVNAPDADIMNEIRKRMEESK